MNEPLNSQKAADLIFARTGRRCSRQNLEKLCRSGRLSLSCVSLNPIRVNPETLIDEYVSNVDPRQQRSALAKPDPIEPPPADAAELKRRVQGLPDDAIPDLNESRARREHYQAELAKLQVTQQRGELVSADEVKKEAFKVGRGVREALANLADRLSHQLAGETDPAVIHQVLTQEHRSALVELCDE